MDWALFAWGFLAGIGLQTLARGVFRAFMAYRRKRYLRDMESAMHAMHNRVMADFSYRTHYYPSAYEDFENTH